MAAQAFLHLSDDDPPVVVVDLGGDVDHISVRFDGVTISGSLRKLEREANELVAALGRISHARALAEEFDGDVPVWAVAV